MEMSLLTICRIHSCKQNSCCDSTMQLFHPSADLAWPHLAWEETNRMAVHGDKAKWLPSEALTFRVLSRRSSLDPECLPGSAPVSKAPAFGHLARAIFNALISAGGSPEALSLWRAFPFSSRTSGTGEDTVFQADLLTIHGNKLKQRQKGDSRGSHSGNRTSLPLQSLESHGITKQQWDVSSFHFFRAFQNGFHHHEWNVRGR